MRVISWNVNGIRAACKKGFAAWLDASGADIVGIQESRADELPDEVRLPGWHSVLTAGQRKGYSGVALFSRRPWSSLETELAPEFDVEGRLQIATYEKAVDGGTRDLVVANGYFPNGNGLERDNSRIPYKLAFYNAVFDRLEARRQGGAAILVMGDFNTAHEAIDLARPKDNVKTSGFTPEERAELDRWLKNGWVDTFRAAHPGQPGHYSWWSQRGGARDKNVGWRIDYVLASEAAARCVERAFIDNDVLGSDHCPIGVELR